MKPVLLFLVIVVAFSTCRQAEKKPVEPTKVHEIKIGRGLSWREIDDNVVFGFKEFWKFNLLNDSFYIKRNATFVDPIGSIEIRGGKFNFKTDSLTMEFVNAALKNQNGRQFLTDTAYQTPLDGEEKYIIQYRRDSINKYFIYQSGPPYYFFTFISRLKTFGRDEQWSLISTEINFDDDSLAHFIKKNHNIKFIPAPPLPHIK